MDLEYFFRHKGSDQLFRNLSSTNVNMSRQDVESTTLKLTHLCRPSISRREIGNEENGLVENNNNNQAYNCLVS